METKLVGHVCDLVLPVCSARYGLERALFAVALFDSRPRVAGLREAAFD
jgi:hypothetical protein